MATIRLLFFPVSTATLAGRQSICDAQMRCDVMFQCLTIILAIVCSSTKTKAGELQFCAKYLESKKTTNGSMVGSVFNFANKLYEQKQELEQSVHEKGQLVKRFTSLEERMIPEILRTSAVPAHPFEFRWAVPREGPQRFPGVLYDGIAY
jgi:hypothetical protein